MGWSPFVNIIIILEEKIHDIDNDSVDCMNACEKHKEEKVFVVALTNAVANPRAVMIMHFNASLTVAAVERSRWSINVARSASCDSDFFPFHNSNKVSSYSI